MSHITSLINALSLIILGFIGYQAGGSATALIPVGFGVVLLILVPGVKKEQMVPAHLAVFLTFTVAFALLKPSRGFLTFTVQHWDVMMERPSFVRLLCWRPLFWHSSVL